MRRPTASDDNEAVHFYKRADFVAASGFIFQPINSGLLEVLALSLFTLDLYPTQRSRTAHRLTAWVFT